MGARGAYGMALKRRGRWFDPALVDAMLGFRDDAAFWGPLEDPRAIPPVAGWEPRDRVLHADDDQLDRVAEAFARVIDAKSPYTASHSAGVATYAQRDRRARWAWTPRSSATSAAPGCCTTSASSRSPAASSTSPAGSTEEEFAAMREHTRFTLQILERVHCFRHLAGIAASHHERLDGSGYHRGLAAFDLPRPARILAVADVFDALTADRPYRDGDAGRAGARRSCASRPAPALCPAAVAGLEAALAAEPGFAATLADYPRGP